jgi:hypothetical protein
MSMKSEALTVFPHVKLTGVAMLLFLTSFIGIMIKTYFPSKKGVYLEIEKLPLDDLT